MKRTKRMKTLSSILLSIFLFLLAGCSGTLPPILYPPTGVSASDASYTDIVQITWDTVSGASHYQVYRADTLLGAKMAISGWQNGTSYDDTNATLEEVYYYWVKAATSSGGDNATGFSSPDTGYCTGIVFTLPPILLPPTGVLASDTLVNKVQITWDTVFGASYYQVYRANNFFATKTAISGWQTGTSYFDTSVTPWTTYYYWVKAATSSIGDNATGFSSPDTGYAILIIISTKEKIRQDKGTFRLSYLNK